MEVTSIEELKKSAQGEIVELPPFSEDVPFVVKLRKPSLLGLAKGGKIPNTLLAIVEQLFHSRGALEKANPSELYDIFTVMAKDAMVEPTYQELEAEGIELTDLQLLNIFNYTQMGARALEGFRKVKRNPADTKPSQEKPAES